MWQNFLYIFDLLLFSDVDYFTCFSLEKKSEKLVIPPPPHWIIISINTQVSSNIHYFYICSIKIQSIFLSITDWWLELLRPLKRHVILNILPCTCDTNKNLLFFKFSKRFFFPDFFFIILFLLYNLSIWSLKAKIPWGIHISLYNRRIIYQSSSNSNIYIVNSSASCSIGK